MDDHSWLSERTKTIIVAVTMSLLVGGMVWGYYEAHQWRAERNTTTEEIDGHDE